jgi:hypothetical protein
MSRVSTPQLVAEETWNLVISAFSTDHYILLHIIVHSIEQLIVAVKEPTLIHERNLTNFGTIYPQ